MTAEPVLEGEPLNPGGPLPVTPPGRTVGLAIESATRRLDAALLDLLHACQTPLHPPLSYRPENASRHCYCPCCRSAPLLPLVMRAVAGAREIFRGNSRRNCDVAVVKSIPDLYRDWNSPCSV